MRVLSVVAHGQNRMTWEIDMDNALENLRQECRYRVNPYMERSEQKEFADYVMDRQHVFDDYMQQAWLDLYQNFREDAGYDS